MWRLHGVIDDRAVPHAGRTVGTRNVETIEGVGTVASPHPLQKALHEHGAFVWVLHARGGDVSSRPIARQSKSQ